MLPWHPTTSRNWRASEYWALVPSADSSLWIFKRLDKRRDRKEAAVDAKVLSMLPYTPTDPIISPRLEDYIAAGVKKR